MTTDSSVFTFELNESLFFEKGQEVAELRGISLDPEISIEAYSEYISIKGVIELSGDYVRIVSEEEEPGESWLNFDNLHVKRYIEKVINVDDEISEFTHRFPIEISVPTYRVNDFNDVTVSIEAFDYEIPEESQLKLYSTIAIHGINREVDHPQLFEDEVDSDEADEERIERELEDTFQFEIKKRQNLEAADKADTAQLERETEDMSQIENKEKQEPEMEEAEGEAAVQLDRETESTTQIENKERQEPKMEEAEGEAVVQLYRETEGTIQIENKEKQELEAGNQEHSPILSESLKVDEDDVGRVKIKSQSFADFFGKMGDVEQEDIEDIEEEIEEEIDDTDNDWHEEQIEEDNYVDREVEDVSYLSDVFRNSEENKFIKMRLCIVQKEDTIETIAERFHVSAIQLIKQNQLEDDFDVSEGQLLYIPAEKK
ncbi:stage VI sporulation protein D [Oceanobacillus chungangensis]|uniref:Stage VI sporulation protein D n=1 Tax=Oceanobacillus chungangensis TaxID=1229152 RepID=A0A3D8PZP6_9BACI|nr:stage VI sporulation protein D [Oceanobacillus chungangensis]RDW21656.1 stage VI sporulation protein D [Oceanobacillus chungangensis]